ncbi:uncharacterized protein LOC105883657 [Microcebus murinus]|uniref:uncharacterized protein LOC105883657 n=1 Tax=Microcebus murinus TaxID=30608 RepID=UPI003F6AFD6F
MTWGEGKGRRERGAPPPHRGTAAQLSGPLPGANTPPFRNCIPGELVIRGLSKAIVAHLDLNSAGCETAFPVSRVTALHVGLTSGRGDVTAHASRRRGSRAPQRKRERIQTCVPPPSVPPPSTCESAQVLDGSRAPPSSTCASRLARVARGTKCVRPRPGRSRNPGRSRRLRAGSRPPRPRRLPSPLSCTLGLPGEPGARLACRLGRVIRRGIPDSARPLTPSADLSARDRRAHVNAGKFPFPPLYSKHLGLRDEGAGQSGRGPASPPDSSQPRSTPRRWLAACSGCPLRRAALRPAGIAPAEAGAARLGPGSPERGPRRAASAAPGHSRAAWSPEPGARRRPGRARGASFVARRLTLATRRPLWGRSGGTEGRGPLRLKGARGRL